MKKLMLSLLLLSPVALAMEPAQIEKDSFFNQLPAEKRAELLPFFLSVDDITDIRKRVEAIASNEHLGAFLDKIGDNKRCIEAIKGSGKVLQQLKEKYGNTTIGAALELATPGAMEYLVTEYIPKMTKEMIEDMPLTASTLPIHAVLYMHLAKKLGSEWKKNQQANLSRCMRDAHHAIAAQYPNIADLLTIDDLSECCFDLQDVIIKHAKNRLPTKASQPLLSDITACCQMPNDILMCGDKKGNIYSYNLRLNEKAIILTLPAPITMLKLLGSVRIIIGCGTQVHIYNVITHEVERILTHQAPVTAVEIFYQVEEERHNKTMIREACFLVGDQAGSIYSWFTQIDDFPLQANTKLACLAHGKISNFPITGLSNLGGDQIYVITKMATSEHNSRIYPIIMIIHANGKFTGKTFHEADFGSIVNVERIDDETGMVTMESGHILKWKHGILSPCLNHMTLVTKRPNLSCMKFLNAYTVLTGDNQGAIRIWNVNTGDLLQTITLPSAGQVRSLITMYPNRIFAVCQDGSVRMIHSDLNQLLTEYKLNSEDYAAVKLLEPAQNQETTLDKALELHAHLMSGEQ